MTTSTRLRRGVLLLLAILAAPAHAGIFVDVGAGFYTKPDNGTWWQDGFANDYASQSRYVRAGAGIDITSRTSVRAFAFSLGEYQLHALATPDDANYNAGSITHCNGPCLPLSTFVTEGAVRGVGASLNYRLVKFLALEIGPTYYRQEFALHVTNRAPGLPATFDAGPDRDWRFGGVLGARFENEHFEFGIYRYSIGGRFGNFPAAVDHWYGCALGWRF